MSMTVEDMKNIVITFVNIAEEQLEEKSFREMDNAGVEILKALGELEQYEAIGTVKVFETVIKSQMDYFYRLREYEKIGIVSEFRELKEKATAKKPKLDGYYTDTGLFECPSCGRIQKILYQGFHCKECGQKLMWD